MLGATRFEKKINMLKDMKPDGSSVCVRKCSGVGVERMDSYMHYTFQNTSPFVINSGILSKTY